MAFIQVKDLDSYKVICGCAAQTIHIRTMSLVF
jgi:hypothetical protein